MKPISNHSIRKVATLILMLLTLSALQAGETFRKDTLLSLPDRNPIKCDISASQSEIELNIYFNLDVDHKAGISFYSPNPKDYTLQLFRLRDNLMEEYALPLRKWIPMVDSVFYAYVPAGNFLARITRSGNTTAHRLHIALVVDPMGPLDAAEAPRQAAATWKHSAILMA